MPTRDHQDPRGEAPARVPLAVPGAVTAVAATLQRAGFEAWVVGESLHALRTGTPRTGYEVSTSASTRQALELFVTAVPTHPKHGTVSVPTASGPVDLLPFAPDCTLGDDLRDRDFTMLAMAWDPTARQLIDPYGGEADLERGLLESVGDPVEGLFQDPVRALRAARLVACHGYTVDPELEAAIGRVGPALMQSPPGRKRSELVRLLMAPQPSRGLALLRRTGIERRLVRRVREDAGALVDALPPVLDIRMAGWLRETRPQGLLSGMRFGLIRSLRIQRMLEHHPLDVRVTPAKDRSLLRLQRLLAAGDIEALFQMREWELARREWELARREGDLALCERDEVQLEQTLASRKQLHAVRDGIERVRDSRRRNERRSELALDGRTVMELLDCGPGRHVGLALRFLAERADSEPTINTPDALRELTLDWARENPDRLPGRSVR